MAAALLALTLAGCHVVALHTTSILTVAPDGSVSVPLSCGSTEGPCTGSIVIEVGGLDSNPAPLSLPPGGTGWIMVVLTAAQYDLVPATGTVGGQVWVDEATPTDKAPRALSVQLKRPGPLTTRVSIATDGTEGTRGFGGADNPAMSADGRFVAFDSQAGNLVVPNDGSSDDVFLRDRLTGTTTRISSAPDGSVGNLPSLSPTISADGRFIAFTSYARNLVASDTNLVPDVFIHDRLTSTTTRVSMAPGGQANGPSEDASMSSDGRFVAFTSDASNLVPGDTNQVRDAFVHDRTTGTTRRVSVASDGRQATNAAFDTSISADGRSVAWTSLAPELVAGDTNGVHDVFVHDLTASTTTRVSVGSARTQASAESSDAILSADGRLVAFASRAPNLVEGDTNGNEDVFVHDLVTATTARVSVGPGGQQGDKRSWQPTISPDGSVVGFASEATNLVEGDTNAYGDVFLHDRSTGATARVSLASDGSQGTVGWSRRPVISADGAHVAFVSGSRTLVVGDTNNEDDIFVRDLTG